MTINEPASTLNVGKKGLILLFDNEKKIERPEAKIDVEVGSSNYIYSAFIELTKAEIDLIINNKLIANRLYIYDGVLENGKKISEYLKCLVK